MSEGGSRWSVLKGNPTCSTLQQSKCTITRCIVPKFVFRVLLGALRMRQKKWKNLWQNFFFQDQFGHCTKLHKLTQAPSTQGGLYSIFPSYPQRISLSLYRIHTQQPSFGSFTIDRALPRTDDVTPGLIFHQDSECITYNIYMN